MTTFDDFRDLPKAVRKHFDELESFIGDVDGKTLCTETANETFIDEGTIYAEEPVIAINALAAEIKKLRAALWPFAMKHQINSGYCADDFKRASEAMGELPVRV